MVGLLFIDAGPKFMLKIYYCLLQADVSSNKPSGYVSSNDNSWDDDDGETAERPVHTLRANTSKLRSKSG